jgi:outer membrane receptor protein involved in Fe transport
MLIDSLKPETSLSYDFGFYRRITKSFDMRATGNYINTDNYFVTNTASTYYNGSYAYQIPTMKFYGAEFEFNWKPSEKLTLFGNYSYLKNEYDRNPSLPYAMILELPPRNKGKLSVRYDLPLKTRFASDIKFVGERMSEGGFTLDRYALADISFERDLANRLTAGFFVNNLFSADYQQVYGYPAAGTSFGFRIQMSTEKQIKQR